MQVEARLGVASISVSLGDSEIAKLKEQFGLTEATITKAAIRAVNQAARWFRKEYIRHARELNVPAKHLRKRLIVRTGKGEPTSAIWTGLKPFDPGKLGKALVRSGSGTQVGKDFIEGGFPAYTKKHRSQFGVWSRKGRKRLPIVREYLDKEEQMLEITRQLEHSAVDQVLSNLESVALRM